jgi:hypothetical protein
MRESALSNWLVDLALIPVIGNRDGMSARVQDRLVPGRRYGDSDRKSVV